MPLSKFGPFAPVFAAGPGYLELLGLDKPSSQIVIDRVERALSAADPARSVEAFFDDIDWRPHLVGAIALLLDDGAVLSPTGLWRAVDAGSWVIPQLVVTAYFIDGDFPGQVRLRIGNRCPVSTPTGLSAVERHSATGPANVTQRSAKLLASLVCMGKRLPSLREWLDRESATPEIAELLEQDIDDAPRIAEYWLARLKEQFALRGRELKPRAA